MQSAIECMTAQKWSFGLPVWRYHSEVVLDQFRRVLLLQGGLSGCANERAVLHCCWGQTNKRDGILSTGCHGRGERDAIVCACTFCVDTSAMCRNKSAKSSASGRASECGGEGTIVQTGNDVLLGHLPTVFLIFRDCEAPCASNSTITFKDICVIQSSAWADACE